MMSPKRAYVRVHERKRLVKLISMFKCRGRWFFTYKTDDGKWGTSDYESGHSVCANGENREMVIDFSKTVIENFSPHSMMVLQRANKINNWGEPEGEEVWTTM